MLLSAPDQYTLPAGNRRRFTFIALVSFLFIAFSIFQLHFHDYTVSYTNRSILLGRNTKKWSLLQLYERSELVNISQLFYSFSQTRHLTVELSQPKLKLH